MADTFKQILDFEAQSFVYSRLEKYGLTMKWSSFSTARKDRYKIVSLEDESIIVADNMMFRQVGDYALELAATACLGTFGLGLDVLPTQRKTYMIVSRSHNSVIKSGLTLYRVVDYISRFTDLSKF